MARLPGIARVGAVTSDLLVGAQRAGRSMFTSSRSLTGAKDLTGEEGNKQCLITSVSTRTAFPARQGNVNGFVTFVLTVIASPTGQRNIRDFIMFVLTYLLNSLISPQ